MKKTKIDIDLENDVFPPKIILEDDNLRFEVHTTETKTSLDVQSYKIKTVEITGMEPEDLTLKFGNFGHIHFNTPEQVKAFVESINEFYNKYLKPLYN